MSIKKLGNAILSNNWNNIQFQLEDSGSNCFSSDELSKSILPEFQNVGEYPVKSNYFLGWGFSEAVGQWEVQHQSAVQEAYKRLNEKTMCKPLRLFLQKNNSRSGLLYCAYKGTIYKFDRFYSEEEMLLQIVDLEDEERQRFERLKHKFSMAEKIEKEGKRPGIPEEIRIAVWRRDGGKCVKCGSRENLEYDHIVPISRGGSNTVRNIELLCESCNRSKSDNIQ